MLLLAQFAKVFIYSTLMLLLATPFGIIIMVNATSVCVFLDPPTQTVDDIGDFFTVNVSIADVVDLYGYEFKLYYNSTVMNGTLVIEGSFLKSGGGTLFKVMNFTDHYDSTHGVVWIVCSLLGNVSGVSGSGVLATIKFRSVSVGDSVPMSLANVELFDSSVSFIPHEVLDGTVTVISEFMPMFVFLTLIVASVFCVLVGKRVTAEDISRH